jgi:hypothetical protein
MCIKATDFVELNEREDFKTSPSSEWSLRHIAFPWFIWPKSERGRSGSMAVGSAKQTILVALMGIVAKPSRVGAIDTALRQIRLNPIARATK